MNEYSITGAGGNLTSCDICHSANRIELSETLPPSMLPLSLCQPYQAEKEDISREFETGNKNWSGETCSLPLPLSRGCCHAPRLDGCRVQQRGSGGPLWFLKWSWGSNGGWLRLPPRKTNIIWARMLRYKTYHNNVINKTFSIN